MLMYFKPDTKLTITDDSGFLAIVNTDLYTSYISEDWELTELFNHFVSEMNKDAIIVWATGTEGEWTLLFAQKASLQKAFREFSKTILVTEEKLYLINYEDLTMAAQFEDSRLPSKHNTDLHITLSNGRYNITVRQLFNPKDADYEPDRGVNFEIVIQQTGKQTKKAKSIFWHTEQ